uniref:ParB-like N-terminal domain-containing protein n=1 Tax=viral metagenome TaxID=1070528 RepID=A0A6M3K305_9ZZZZ
MEITKIQLSKIEPNKFNPNSMPLGTFKKMLSSIKKFGLFNPIIVRQKGDKYEIIDGEQRYKAFKELSYPEIDCRIIKATDEEVKQMIFATTIKGKHNAFDSQEALKGMLEGATTETLNACNLDKTKLERKTKYINYDKGVAVQKGKNRLVDESTQCENIKDYVSILAIPLKKEEYELAIKKLKELDKDISKAFIRLIGK